ncbi:MFS transporter [Amycolatopsis umgeniensis]|uniref:Putative MFS family arabinose efflux permease n=1 Tax=Amycolatopsis umgeniensis TaxID=336628 RepID=A0A841B8P2_9PSEU|nr:MFS transporter [Amycolatopsis umgeniensis]MBB5854948.1 putative MFS family arabinose efflux permease [Amycolatopsis umgeniensis]
MTFAPPRTAVLALGTFAVGTSGYVVAGLLPALTGELGVSETAAAQLVTAFAIAYAVGSPLFAAVTGRWERRTLLVAALVVTAIGNALAALAPGYVTLLLARVVTAIGAAVFTPAASAVAAELTSPERRGRAVALVFGGLTIATILGVPLGSVLSQSVGYQAVFGLVAAFSLLGALAVRMVLPAVPAPPPVRLAERFTVAKDPRVLAMLGATVLGCLAAFSVYTFISPVLSATAGVHGTTVSLLLFVYGAGGALGNVLGGRATDRWGARAPLLVVFAGITVVLAMLPLVATSVAGAAVVLFLWGLATWSINPPIQHRLIELSSQNAGLVLSLNASAIYLGVGLSGLVGGAVLSGGGPLLLPEIAAVLTAIAAAVVVAGWRSRVRQPAPAE